MFERRCCYYVHIWQLTIFYFLKKSIWKSWLNPTEFSRLSPAATILDYVYFNTNNNVSKIGRKDHSWNLVVNFITVTLYNMSALSQEYRYIFCWLFSTLVWWLRFSLFPHCFYSNNGAIIP